MAQTVIDAHNVCKVYNPGTIQVKALTDVHLHVEEGEFTALVGPSGSGKSTLLNIIGGLDKPTAGNVMVAGEDLASLTSNKLIDFRLHHIGFVFQSFNLVPVLTAKENISLVMLMQGASKKERDLRAEELLFRVGMSDKMDVRPGELSGGQQQRVAVARAMASKPKFILADEPTANLDSKSAANLLDMMAELNREDKTTFIFSTHDPRVIEKARRVVTLEDGRIVGDTAQIPLTHA
ncbi:MAG: ABC transporter ATP-binding protein [Bacteroidota bacterium]|jgi:putative ABC transport system ATP-binding protein